MGLITLEEGLMISTERLLASYRDWRKACIVEMGVWAFAWSV